MTQVTGTCLTHHPQAPPHARQMPRHVSGCVIPPFCAMKNGEKSAPFKKQLKQNEIISIWGMQMGYLVISENPTHLIAAD